MFPMERLNIDKQPFSNDFKLTRKPHGAARLAHMPECFQGIRAMRQITRSRQVNDQTAT